jgi:hypothetical protein
VKRFAVIFFGLLALIASTQAGILTQGVRGTAGGTGIGGGEGGEWADVYVALSGVPAQLATANRVVGIDGTTINDFGPFITADNGCEITFESGGAYDGENAVKLIPPDALEQPAYCGILSSNLTNSGANDIAQINIRWVAVIGPRYIDLASSPKWLCVGISSTAAGSRLNRACTFETYESSAFANGRIYAITSDETQSWHEPEITDCYHPDCGTAAQKGFIVRTTANHAGSPAVAGPNEPIYFELELDVRQNRGNENGRNRLYVRTRDGLIDRTIDIPLTWEGTWNFTWDQIIEIEGLGWYFNTPGTAHADNWIRYSHIAISRNRAVNDPIGPPPGFNTSLFLLLAAPGRRRRKKLRAWIAAALLLVAGPVAAQVTHSATATVDLDAGTTTLSTSITTSGATDAVCIGVVGEGQTSNPTVTFAAQTPTLLARNDEFEPSVWLYYVLPSGTGSQAINVTFAASCGRCALGAVAYDGVDQSTPVGTAVVGATSSTTTHEAVVSAATNDLVCDVAYVGTDNITVGAGQTVRYDEDDFLSVFRSFGMSDEPGAASVTMSWTTSGATDGTVIAVPLKASAGGGGGSSVPVMFHHYRQMKK